jgi:hypothetical protein
MTEYSLHPPGEKVARAIKELSELLETHPETERARLLQKVIMQFDLSPKEADFLERHFQ